MTAHTYYQPNQAEDLLITAGWIKPEEVDSDYQQYAKTADPEFLMDYAQWQTTKKLWDEFNDCYEREIDPFFPDEMTAEKEALSNSLLRQMTQLESALGY